MATALVVTGPILLVYRRPAVFVKGIKIGVLKAEHKEVLHVSMSMRNEAYSRYAGFGVQVCWAEVAVNPCPRFVNTQLTEIQGTYYCGVVEYETEFLIPQVLSDQRRVLRFDAVTHDAEVIINGRFVCSHKGGFLPFEVDITNLAACGMRHRLLVRVNNRIDWKSLPIGNESGTASSAPKTPGFPVLKCKETSHFLQPAEFRLLQFCRNHPSGENLHHCPPVYRGCHHCNFH